MNIKQSTKEDLQRVAELRLKLWEFEKQKADVVDIQIPEIWIIEDEIREFYDDDNHSVFIAEDDGMIEGFIMGYIKDAPEYLATENNRKIGTIEAIFLEEQYREKGVWDQLVKTLINWFDTKNVGLIQISVLANITDAIRLYQQNGFELFFHRMVRVK